MVALDVKFNTVRPITEERASVSAQQDADTGVVLIDYADGTTPQTLFTVDTIANASTRTSWRQLTDPNPQVRGFALGQQEEITWKSKDGTTVGGVLVKPVGYRAGQRYPLIVAIHGGPASADVLSFNGGYGSQVYAGAGYVVLRPNYRGSTNYGNKLQTDIVGNYMAPGYDDIMAGVDHLIAQGMADPDRMGALGWSAGGHWSNWILTHTDRFKAISTGAGTSNWISMYAQSDVQRNRQFYLGNKLPYDDFDAYWNAVAAQVHQEREDADDDPRGGGRSARAEPAVDRAAHGAQAAGRADGAVHVSRQHARHPRSAQPAGEVGERDGVDGSLRARHEHEVLLARRAEDAGRRGRRPERDVAAALARAWPGRCSLQLPMRRISMPVSRRFVRLAAWLVVLLLLPHDSRAQTVEVTPFGGYRVGGGFFDVPNGRVVDDDAAPSVGLLVNVDVGLETPGLKFEGAVQPRGSAGGDSAGQPVRVARHRARRGGSDPARRHPGVRADARPTVPLGPARPHPLRRAGRHRGPVFGRRGRRREAVRDAPSRPPPRRADLRDLRRRQRLPACAAATDA